MRAPPRSPNGPSSQPEEQQVPIATQAPARSALDRQAGCEEPQAPSRNGQLLRRSLIDERRSRLLYANIRPRFRAILLARDDARELRVRSQSSPGSILRAPPRFVHEAGAGGS